MNDLRQQILKRIGEQPRLVKVPIPEWGVDVWIKRLTWDERVEDERRRGKYTDIPESDEEGRVRWMIRYAADIALGESGKRIFSPEDEQTLFRDSLSTATERIALAGIRLNSVRQEELAELGKGSTPVMNGASPSGSPDTSG